MSGRRSEPEASLDVDLFKRAFVALIREQVELAVKESLPLLLKAGETRRPPQVAGQAAAESLDPQYLTRQQVATVTGYSARTIARLIDSGKLRACGPRRDRITRFEVDRMMAKREEEGAEETGVDAIDPDAEAKAEVDRLMGRK